MGAEPTQNQRRFAHLPSVVLLPFDGLWSDKARCAERVDTDVFDASLGSVRLKHQPRQAIQIVHAKGSPSGSRHLKVRRRDRVLPVPVQ